DGKLLAVASVGGVALLSPATGRRVRILPAHLEEISELDITRDGRLLVTAGGSDETLKLWRLEPEAPETPKVKGAENEVTGLTIRNWGSSHPPVHCAGRSGPFVCVGAPCNPLRADAVRGYNFPRCARGEGNSPTTPPSETIPGIACRLAKNEPCEVRAAIVN